MHEDHEDTVLISRAPAARPASDAGDLDDTIIRTPSAPGAPVLDSEDTIIRVPLRGQQEQTGDIDDTIVRERRSLSEPAPEAVVPPAPAAPASTAINGFTVGGRIVPLDRPCLIGRHPSAPRIVSGAPPVLVKVASPRSQISSTHVELREAGSQVVVTDLRSTNGTTVTTPGSNPRKLRQGESIVVGVGALVDIGDDIILTVVSLSAADREKTR